MNLIVPGCHFLPCIGGSPSELSSLAIIWVPLPARASAKMRLTTTARYYTLYTGNFAENS